MVLFLYFSNCSPFSSGKLAGIVSFGYTGCTDAGVYAKVSQFTDWIAERWQE